MNSLTGMIKIKWFLPIFFCSVHNYRFIGYCDDSFYTIFRLNYLMSKLVTEHNGNYELFNEGAFLLNINFLSQRLRMVGAGNNGNQ